MSATRDASFSERSIAFAADYAVFAGIWFLLLRLSDPATPPLLNPRGSIATATLTLLFVAYQAWFSADGRTTLGKALLGLRVTDPHGQPLDLERSLLRAVLYLPSSFLCLGFFWSLIDPNGRAWHDLPFHSRVMAPRRSAAALALASAGSGLLLVVFAAAWGWHEIWGPRYERIMTVANAQFGLNELGRLQASYHRRHGRYAGSLFSLASVSVDPAGLIKDSAAFFSSGQVAMKADEKHFSLVARANDVDRTLVAVSGP